MNREQVAKQYDENESYQALRDISSVRYKAYKIEVEEWKIPNLCSVIPPEFKYYSIAEVGCATGELIASFPPHEERIPRYGFDISFENIQCARERFPFVTFFDEDFKMVDLKVDMVIISDVLEHVPDDVNFLSSLKKLSPYILANISLERCWLYKNRKYGLSDYALRLRAYDETVALNLIKKAGFEVIQSRVEWFIEQACYKKHLALSRGIQHVSFARRVKRLGYDLLCKNRWFRRRYFPRNLFCLIKAK